MQHTEPDGIVISCDFCRTAWDEVIPMIEGHRGSVLCLPCLRRALDEAASTAAGFECTLCLQSFEAGRKAWLSEHATVCWPCIRLAAKGFHKDKDIDFRWDPAQYPVEPEHV